MSIQSPPRRPIQWQVWQPKKSMLGVQRRGSLLQWSRLLGSLLLGSFLACSTTPPPQPEDDPFLSVRDPNAALRVLTVKAEQSPDDPGTLRELGTTYMRMSRYLEAIEPLQRAASLQPSHCETWGQLALSFQRTERTEDAALAYGKAFSCAPKNLEYLSNYKKLMESLSLEDELVTRISLVLRGRPDDVQLLNPLITDYLKAGKLGPAEQAAKASLGLVPDQTAVLTALGLIYERQGRFEDGLMTYQRLLKLNPTDLEAELGATRCILGKREFDDAARRFEKLLARAPERLDIVYGLIEVSLARDDFARASVLLRDAISRAPDSSLLQLAQAELYLKQGRPDQTLTVLGMMSPSPDEVNRHVELYARASIAAGQPAQALPVLEARLQSNPELELLKRLRCTAMLRAGYQSRWEAECQGIATLEEFDQVRDGVKPAASKRNRPTTSPRR